MNEFIFNGDLFKVLIPEKQLDSIINEMAYKAMKYLIKNKIQKLYVVVVYKGASYFAHELLKRITAYIFKNNLQIEIVEDDIKARSYDENNVPIADIQILSDLKSNIRNKDVIILEDYADRCKTMPAIISYITSKDPKSLKTFVLLGNNEYKKELDYLKEKFDVEFGIIMDKPGWIVGAGLDDSGTKRGWPFIACKLDKTP